jgi:hypothetical protein
MAHDHGDDVLHLVHLLGLGDEVAPERMEVDQASACGPIEAHEFARRDFPQSGYNVHRLSREVTQLLLHNASLSPATDSGGGGVDDEDHCGVWSY